MKKTHYRRAYKSDHLSSSDLEDLIEQGVTLNFTIDYVKFEVGATVAGRKGNFNIAYFKEKIKPLVLNATNAEKVKKFAKSSFVEDWNNIPITLYIKQGVRNVSTGEIGGAVRIKPTQPRKETMPTLDKSHPKWDELLTKLKNGEATLELVKKHFSISASIEELLKKSIKDA